jgi:hypothetical protein
MELLGMFNGKTVPTSAVIQSHAKQLGSDRPTFRSWPPKSNGGGVDCIHEKTIHAKVVAKALSFPDQIEIDYYPVDEFGKWAGPGI